MQKRITTNPLSPYLYFMLAALAMLSSSRLLLCIWQNERVTAVEGWQPVLLQGLRVDISTLCVLLLLPMLVSAILSGPNWLVSAWHKVVQAWLSLLASALVFMEFATPSFINEYNIRPNRLFVEYLVYPKEVFSMLIKSHPLELIFTSIISIAVAVFTWRFIAKLCAQSKPIAWKPRTVVALLVFVTVFLGARSTLGHRPLNPAMVYFSTDPLANSLILNSFYSTAFAATQLFTEETKTKIYGDLADDEVIKSIREFKGITAEPMLDKEIPSLAAQQASYRGKPKNLVIILEESLGARFVGSLGGLPLTPNLDELSEQGWYFQSMLATGTRSVRGIEAVVTGFTPTPDRSVVKLGNSQKNFFTIAELLQLKGYHTEFIYGGEAHFDNMKSFFLGNGFASIIEQKDYQNPQFVASWGASDEDLFNKADERFREFKAKDQPFFSLVFSSSNHTPFEYPQGRIEAYDDEYHTRNNAIKYADWALGQFFEKAKQSDYWQDTVFLVVADHDANAHGLSLVPPKSFHIPALILGAGIDAKKEPRIVSQMDMPPTLLSLIGIDNVNPMLGRDLTKFDESMTSRAVMQYGQNFALLEGKNVTVLQPGKSARRYLFDHEKYELIDQHEDASQQEYEKALAISLWGKLAYLNHYYRLPQQQPSEIATPTNSKENAE